MNLTQKTASAIELPDGKSEVIQFDDDLPGFGLRIRRGGARTWVYQFKLGTQHRRVTIGTATAITAAQARKTANEMHAKVRLGRDPSGEKTEERARAAETMLAALDTYFASLRERVKPDRPKHLKPMKRGSLTQIERHLLKHCKPLHGRQLAKIDRRAVTARMDAVEATSGPIEANRVQSSLAAFFAWCMRKGLVAANPVVGSTERRKEHSRDHVIGDADLRVIWNATEGDDDYSAVVRLIALTGSRAAEIGALRWSEIKNDQIVLPGERVKNGRTHTIPIVPAVRAILDARPRREDRDFVFGRRKDRPLTGWSVCKAALDERIRTTGAVVEPWVHHDLRRTMATRLADLGIAPHIIEALLNHVSGHKHGVAGIYNRSDYEPQKRHALTLWAQHLAGIVEGRSTDAANVVAFA